jgi:hypothetical protein
VTASSGSHQPAAQRARLVVGGDDLGDVALEVADRGVDLGERDPEAAHVGIVLGGVAAGRIVNPRPIVLYAGFHKRHLTTAGSVASAVPVAGHKEATR